MGVCVGVEGLECLRGEKAAVILMPILFQALTGQSQNFRRRALTGASNLDRASLHTSNFDYSRSIAMS